MSHPVVARLLTACALSFVACSAWPAAPYVPPELEPWRRWVLHGEEFRDCPVLVSRAAKSKGDFLCIWSGPLVLDVGARGASFHFELHTYVRERIALPGERALWPQDVTVDDRAATVVEQGGRPTVELEAGVHRVRGRFVWERRPDRIALPAWLGIVALTLDGRSVRHTERDAEGIWLGRRPAAAGVEEKDTLTLSVYRRIEDGVPLIVTTRLNLDVSGRAREETLRHALLPGFVPVAIASELPGRLGADGRLTLQVRPGHWEIELRARAHGVPGEVAVPAAADGWPEEEIWSFHAVPRLRDAVLEGGTPVDPLQSGVPDAWRNDFTVLVPAGSRLTLTERSRGLSEPDELTLERELWLDFDGQRFTAIDSISGRLRSGWRLDMALPWSVERATEAESELLVTRGTVEGQTGVEVRLPNARLRAQARLAKDGWTLPATGWTREFRSATVALHLPPGTRLLAAAGVDASEGDWLTRWDLFDMFLWLVLAASAWKLFGVRWGVIALVALGLVWHEDGAPVWPLLFVFAGVALARATREGRFHRLARLGTGAAFLTYLTYCVLLVPFAAQELRFALYPTLERPPVVRPMLADKEAEALAPPAAPESLEVAQAPAMADEEKRARERREVTASRAKQREPLLARVAPNALIQAGSGEPSWSWHEARLTWNGPVGPHDRLTLVILPRPLTALWHVLDVLGLALLAWVGLAALRPDLRLPGVFGRWLAVSPVALLAVLAAFTAPSPVWAAKGEMADLPSQPLLDELKTRLTAPPRCAGQCAAVARAELRADAAELALTLEVHAEVPVAVPLPQGNAWEPVQVSVAGRSSGWLARREGNVYVALAPGVHRIVLRGPLPAATAVTVSFPLVPHAIAVQAEGWQVGGVREGRLLTDAVELVRVRGGAAARGVDLAELSRVPPFVRVVRRITLDLDWTVHTRVERLAPQDGAFTVTVPLLEEEEPLKAGLEVHERQVSVAFAPGEDVVEWQGRLPRRETFRLTARDTPDAVEVWRLVASPMWHVETAGLPAVLPEHFDPDDDWTYEYLPYPGESLAVTVMRPEAVPGGTLAIDRARHRVVYGQRAAEGELDFEYRSTRGGTHAIVLPGGAALTALTVDGVALPLHAEGVRVPLTLQPGRHHVTLGWRQGVAPGWRTVLPPVDLGAPIRNIDLELRLPENRWIFLTQGPRVGPAVLYWAELAVFVLLAFAVARARLTPLPPRDWLLLGLGLSTWSWGTLVLVAFWLHALGLRERAQARLRGDWFNVVQVALALLTLIALGALIAAVPGALLGHPDLHVVGNGSRATALEWFADRAEGALPAAAAWTLPLWLYQVAILAWALWLSLALLRWLRWGWSAYSAGGWWRSASLRLPQVPPS
ncbi:MAG TPA: hypothetical protein VNL72_00975 [Gammaproteobacteria bacterium]|nr:hypothetical protein [Gammaproteobacteria bacterium]